MIKKSLKAVASRFGITSTQPFWEPIALKYYHQKLKNDIPFREWVEKNKDVWIKGHWSHFEVVNEFDLLHLCSQIYGIIHMMRKRTSDFKENTVLDAGASDGMFLSQLGVQKGTGVNILMPCVEKIKSQGFSAVQGSAEELPFEDKSFDYVIMCQTLEHCVNPLRALDELARVCRKKIFLTTPHLPATRVNVKPKGWPAVEGHIVEFSDADLRKAITYTHARIAYHDVIDVFPEPRNPATQFFLKNTMYPWYFPKLHYYELRPISDKEFES